MVLILEVSLRVGLKGNQQIHTHVGGLDFVLGAASHLILKSQRSNPQATCHLPKPTTRGCLITPKHLLGCSPFGQKKISKSVHRRFFGVRFPRKPYILCVFF